MKKDLAWISTFTGKKFFLLHPSPKEIDIRDIAHALSLQCRWTGHCLFHYSVAQHSYYCSLICPPEDALECLMHDSSESFMGDMNRPLKYFTAAGPAYRAQEAVVSNAIAVKFGLKLPEPASVKIADDAMLYAERYQIMSARHKWNVKYGDGRAAQIKIERWSPAKAEKVFLKRFHELRKEKQCESLSRHLS